VAELIANFVQRHEIHLTDGTCIYRPVSGMREWEKGNGGLEGSQNPFAPCSFWGRRKCRDCCGHRTYWSRNSGLTIGAPAPLLPRSPVALLLTSFPFDHGTQALTAAQAAKLLAGTVRAQCEAFVRARTLREKNGEIRGWMVTLAALLWRHLSRHRGSGKRHLRLSRLGLSWLPTLGAMAVIPLTLVPPLLAFFKVLAVLLAVAFLPLSVSGFTALGATISTLRISGAKRLLTSLEQPRSPPRMVSPLISPRFAASWC
jgi:hypothetical protein